MVKESVDIESAFRPLNVLSKILGLAHFSGHRNSFKGKIKDEENREKKFRNVIWCVVVTCTVVTGFVLTIINLKISSHFTVFQIVVVTLSIPIGYLRTLVALIAGLTWNRNKFPEFVLKMSVFDKYLLGAKRVGVYRKQYKSCIIQLTVIHLILFPFYCYNVYVYGVYVNYISVYHYVSDFIKEVVVVQFINVVWMIRERLEYLNK